MSMSRSSRREGQDDGLIGPEEAFERAAKIRLRLNREARSKASAKSAPPSDRSETTAVSFLDPAALDKASREQAILDRHPGLTREGLEEMLDEV